MSNNTLKVFQNMKQLLSTHGWNKNIYIDNNGSYDIMGAIYQSLVTQNLITSRCIIEVRDQLMDSIRSVHGDKYSMILEFNDDPNITFQDVIDVLDISISTVENMK